MVGTKTFLVTIAMALVASTSIETPVAGAAAVPESGGLAQTVEQVPEKVGGIRVARKLKKEAVAAFNKSATADYGKITAEQQDILGQSTYFVADDVEVYFIDDGDGNPISLSTLSVPANATVHADGSVELPELMDPEAAAAPIFGGDWGQVSMEHIRAKRTNDGGAYCNDNEATNDTKIRWAKLKDSSSDFDYYGVDLVSAAKISKDSGYHWFWGSCDDYLDWFSQKLWSAQEGAEYMVQDPINDYDGKCHQINVSVSADLGVVSGSVSGKVRQCLHWIVENGNVGSASLHYRTLFDNKKDCGNARDSRQAAVIAVGQAEPLQLWFGSGVQPGSVNKDAEFGGCGNGS